MCCHFQATVQKLQTEGVQLNSPAVMPAEVCVSEEDPDWVVYRWKQEKRAAWRQCGKQRSQKLRLKYQENNESKTSSLLNTDSAC